jgi:hypothetical protein
LDLEALGCAFAELGVSPRRAATWETPNMHHHRCHFLNAWDWIIGSMTLDDVERYVGKSIVSSLR